jgi:hypothetical protein
VRRRGRPPAEAVCPASPGVLGDYQLAAGGAQERSGANLRIDLAQNRDPASRVAASPPLRPPQRVRDVARLRAGEDARAVATVSVAGYAPISPLMASGTGVPCADLLDPREAALAAPDRAAPRPDGRAARGAAANASSPVRGANRRVQTFSKASVDDVSAPTRRRIHSAPFRRSAMGKAVTPSSSASISRRRFATACLRSASAATCLRSCFPGVRCR